MIQQTLSWLIDYQTLLTWMGIGSLLLFVLSLLLLPWFIKKIPADYFQRPPKTNTWRDLLTPLNIARNLLGGTVLIAGIVMLVLPGQGLLTIFAGIAIMQFPGKHELERWLISRNGILKAVNWIRRKTHTAELEV